MPIPSSLRLLSSGGNSGSNRGILSVRHMSPYEKDHQEDGRNTPNTNFKRKQLGIGSLKLSGGIIGRMEQGDRQEASTRMGIDPRRHDSHGYALKNYGRQPHALHIMPADK